PENDKNKKTKEEMNLVEYPFQYLSFKVPPIVKTVEWHGETVTKDGVVRQASWIVTGSDKYGLPRYDDKDVLLALLYFWKEQGFQSQVLRVDSILDVVKVLHWTVSGNSYKKLDESLSRLVGITIKAIYSFWDNRIKDYLPIKAFHLLDNYSFEKIGHKTSLIVKASDEFWESIKSGYIKTLDLEFYLSLKEPLLKALYSYLDKKAYQNEEFTIDIMKLAEHLGMSLNRGLKRIKYDIRTAADVLVSRGFLEGYFIQDKKITFYFNREYLTRKVQEQVKEVEDKIERLVSILKKELGDDREDSYYRIARYYPIELIFKALDGLRTIENEGKGSRSRYRLFMKLLKGYIKTEIRDKIPVNLKR
ncbi:replication initiator protein A, partial [bacterium]|nr:replication initiator protein A [bacterium]